MSSSIPERLKAASISTLPLVLLALLALFPACQSDPLYLMPATESPHHLSPQAGSEVAIFSFLLRSVAVSRSQGRDWVVRQDEDDYELYYSTLARGLSENHALILRNRDEIRNHPLVLDGFFPLRERFYLNPATLPIVRSAAERELMLRTARSLEVDYFALILADYSISKLMFGEPTLRARLLIEWIDASNGVSVARWQLQSESRVESCRPSFQLDHDHLALCAALSRTSLEELLQRLAADLSGYSTREYD